ncbi:MAG: hypothetical protein A2289_11260 [Deltaproteobacteria bacterium RIFOXYA12_FULL_58_15]|nr:MAG: hypothetical protein A2289_11260 [Deltaproteobacteria bacterium RIFOXYA12_FULL_58_15]OGR14989.1 MAG: hypothetical protein A2341_17745 [Deltaproteobacteria bacterium RIFOXYB12_FULL_58_9]
MALRWMIAAFLVTTTASTGVGARSSLSALRPRLDPTTLPAVAATCVDGSSGWRTAENREALQQALAAFPWKERSFQTPEWDCRLSLEVACAPNIDGDDQSPDFIARVRWSQRIKSAKGKRCTSLKEDDAHLVEHEAILAMNKNGTGAWRAVAVIDYNSDTIDGMARSRVDFVELPSGKVGLRCKTQTEKGGKGCKVLSYWVGALVGERIDRLGEADPEFCTPD